ncbi:MAG: gamma-glutamyl-gamma-aminobutyrate hydrolase family protein [Deinococcales bacterium]
MGRRGLRRNDTIQGHNYALAMAAAGAVPLLAPNVDAALADRYADAADGLLLTGGVDIDPYLFDASPHPDLGSVDRRRDAFELALYRAFRERGKPVLGICRGIQLVNVAHGGSLHQHLPRVPDTEQHAQRDVTGAPLQRVALETGSRLAEAFGTQVLRVNSFHHQAVDRVGDGLRAVARADDGIVEALELEDGDDAFVVAVQWHPEMCWDTHPEHHTPFRMLADACRSQRRAAAGTDARAGKRPAAGR